MLYEDVSEKELCIYYHAVQTYVVHDRVDAEIGLWVSPILFDLKCSGVSFEFLLIDITFKCYLRANRRKF